MLETLVLLLWKDMKNGTQSSGKEKSKWSWKLEKAMENINQE